MDKKKSSILASALLLSSYGSLSISEIIAEDIVVEEISQENAFNSDTSTSESDITVEQPTQSSTESSRPESVIELEEHSEDLNNVVELQQQIDFINDTKSATNEELKDVLNSINGAEKELSTILSEISILSLNISDKKEAIVKLQHSLESLEKEIKIVEDKVTEQEMVLGSSLSFLYENMDSGFFQLFFQSENLTDFLKAIDFMNLMVDSNDEIFDELVELEESLVKKKGLYEKDLKDLNKALDDLNRDAKLLEEKQFAQQILLDKHKEIEEQKIFEIEQQESHIDELNVRINQILSNIAAVNSGSSNAPLTPDQKLAIPMKSGTYYISSLYGYRIHPVYGYSKFHNGIDFAAAYGEPIYSVGNGTVIDSGPATGFGNWIVIRNDSNGLYSIYGHMEADDLYVRAGDRVYQGQLISRTGSAGTSTGPHLHYGTATDYTGGKFNYIDPLTTFK